MFKWIFISTLMTLMTLTSAAMVDDVSEKVPSTLGRQTSSEVITLNITNLVILFVVKAIVLGKFI